MIKIIEAMYELANEEDRSGDKAPDKRVDLIMQRLNKDKSGKYLSSYSTQFVNLLLLDVVLRNEFIQGCLRDEILRKILAPNTAIAPGGQAVNTMTTTTTVPMHTTTSINETGAAV